MSRRNKCLEKSLDKKIDWDVSPAGFGPGDTAVGGFRTGVRPSSKSWGGLTLALGGLILGEIPFDSPEVFGHGCTRLSRVATADGGEDPLMLGKTSFEAMLRPGERA
jgi:hypothetical protein